MSRNIRISLPGGLLGFVFIYLKVAGYVTWPWLWVLSPFWMPLAIVASFIGIPVIGMAIVGLLYGVALGVDKLIKHFRR